MSAQRGRKSKLPLMADIAEAIAAGETTTAAIAAEYGVTLDHLEVRLRKAGYDSTTGLRPVVAHIPFARDIGDEPLDWQADAACTKHAPELWFADSAATANKAKAICADCPVRLRCLDWAIRIEGDRSHDTRAGIYGGMTSRARWALSKGGAA